MQDDHNAISPEEEWQKLTGAAARLDAWIKSAKAEKPEDREKLDIIGAGFQCIKEGLLNGQAMVQELTGEADTRRSQKKLVQAILAVRDAADPELAPAAQGADRSMLMQYVDAGFTLYAKKEFQGARVFCDWHRPRVKNDKDHAAVHGAEELDQALGAGVQIFDVLPGERGFFALDIDRGHADNLDGGKALEQWLKGKGIDAEAVRSLCTVTVSTPSGGVHVYFKDPAGGRYRSTVCRGVDIRGGAGLTMLTCAGSFRNGRLYRMKGELGKAPRLPGWFAAHLRPPQPETPSWQPRQSKGKAPLLRLVEWGLENARRKGAAGRNEEIYWIAYRAGSLYPFEDILGAVLARYPTDASLTLDAIKETVKSGIRNSKYGK